jgi:type I restriction enzyme, R subunit
MRHLIDTYIEADEPRKISPFDDMGLLELIVKTGIANAIALQLDGLKGNKDAIAETIENNVRRKIIKEHLSDPAYYETMSALLDEIIALRKSRAIEYEEYLRRVALVARGAQAGQAEDTPEPLKNSPALRALYNNLKRTDKTLAQAGLVSAPPSGDLVSGDPVLDLALRLDAAVKQARPDGWRDVQAREQTIKQALYNVLGDAGEVERIFPIIKAQGEY